MCQHEFRNSEWTDIQIQITSRNLGNAKKKRFENASFK